MSRDIPGASQDLLAKAIAAASARRKARGSKLAAELEAEHAADQRLSWSRNRESALRGPVDIQGTPHWWCVCVCRWSGLRVPDPEAAKREYDKHPCGINGDAAVDRALAELEQTERFVEPDKAMRTAALSKRPASTLIPALEQERNAQEERLLGGERVEVVTTEQEQTDATEQRMGLLELK